MADEPVNPGPLPSAQAAATEDFSIYINQSVMKGGEECWSCGLTPGTNETSTMPGILITGAGEEFEEAGEYKQIELCEECAAEIFRFFTLEHLAFLKDKEKHKDWIFAKSPCFPGE